ncbi:MAG: two-component system sensor histidine kinase GlrK [Pseudohongiellaceae bacterium]|jgi:two-component system sensor histidine kinase GlrK
MVRSLFGPRYSSGAGKVIPCAQPMLPFKPRSIKQLTVTGFLIVVAVLILALILTARQISGLSLQSQDTLRNSAQAMHAVRVVIEQASAMERNIRQFQIVGDREIFNVYQERRRVLANAALQLQDLELDATMDALVEQLRANDAFNYGLLTQENQVGVLVSRDVKPLLDVAYLLSNQLGDWTSAQLEYIQRESESTQIWLLFQAAFLTMAALLLAGFFTAKITRPLLQIEKAINQLGSGTYDTGIIVGGPEDLVSLGNSLDWLRSRLKSLEQQRSSFLRHVSHELKTPLAAIQESAALIQDGVAGEVSDEQHKLLTILVNNSQRLHALIDDLLRYHADILSVLNTMPHPVRLDKVIESVLMSHDFVIKTGKLSVVTELDKIQVSGDPEQLRVIVDNLITNAIKFAPEAGSITVRLSQQQDAIVLDIIDNGPGISTEEKEKIFEAFYQGAASARNFFKGSGLGLAIVQEYINANRGSIEVVTCEEGAHFRITLPQELQSI